jgi:hypothetical protein
MRTYEGGSTKATQGARQAYDERCPFDLLPLSMKDGEKCIKVARNFHEKLSSAVIY